MTDDRTGLVDGFAIGAAIVTSADATIGPGSIVGDMDDFARRMRALAVRVLGYLLLASAVAVGIAFVVQQGMHNNHVAAVREAQAEPGPLPWVFDSDWVNGYPEPSVALYLTGAALCLASGFLILEPGLRRVVKRAVQASDTQPVQ